MANRLGNLPEAQILPIAAIIGIPWHATGDSFRRQNVAWLLKATCFTISRTPAQNLKIIATTQFADSHLPWIQQER